MFNFYKSFLFTFLLSCYASVSYAVLDAVIVSAARTEQSGASSAANITTITRQDIESSGESHIVDVLRGQSGVLIEDTFGDGSRAIISMRGFSGSVANSNTLILVDGRRLNNSDISSPDLNSISLKDVERIEIIQGSSGVLYGDQAVGGVVNIITKRLEGETGSLEATAGSYQTMGFRAAYGNNLTNKLHYGLSAEFRQSDNYRRDNNEIEYSNLFAKSEYRYDRGVVFAELQQVSEDLRTPGSLLASEIAIDRRQTFVDFLGDFTDSTTEVFRFGLKHKMSSRWSLEGEVTQRDVERDIQQSFRGFAVLTPSTLKRKQMEFMPRLIGVIPYKYGDIQLTAGIDLIDTDFDSEITTSTDNQAMLAEYIQVVFPLQQKLNMTAGFRHAEVEDDITSTFTNGKQNTSITVAELGLAYEMSNKMKLFGRFDQNFRFAKVDELTYVSPGVQLRPQTGESIELGVQYLDGVASYKLSAYQLVLEDEIAFDSTAPQPVGAFFAGANVNFDPTTHQGVLFDVRYAISSAINLSGGYTYTDAGFDSGVFAGNAISGVAENSARMSVNYQFSKTLNINLGGCLCRESIS